MAYARFYDQDFHDRYISDEKNLEDAIEWDELDYLVPSDVYVFGSQGALECYHNWRDKYVRGVDDFVLYYEKHDISHAEACATMHEYLTGLVECGFNVPHHCLERLLEESQA